MDFIWAHRADILVIALLAVVLFLIFRSFYKRKKKGHSVACFGCSCEDKCMAAPVCPSCQETCTCHDDMKKEV